MNNKKKVCIDFIYSGGSEITFEMSQLNDLYKMAVKLELNELAKLCELIRLRNEEKLRIQNYNTHTRYVF